MKLLISIIIAIHLLLFAVSSHSKQKEQVVRDNLALAEGLKGRVRQVISETNYVTNRWREKQIVHYDSQGYKQTVWREVGDEIWEEKYTYDAAHHLIKKEEIYDGDLLVVYEAKYNAQGSLVEEIEREPERDDPVQTRHVYDSNSNRESTCKYISPSNEPYVCLSYTYDSRNRIELVRHFNEQKQLSLYETYSYDDEAKIEKCSTHRCLAGKCVIAEEEISVYGQDGSVNELSKYTANKELRWKKMFTRLAAGNNAQEITLDNRSDGFVKTTEAFNKFNDLISTVEEDKDGKLLSIEKATYLYDKQNNWISRECFSCKRNGSKEICRKSATTKRVVLYY